MFNRLVRVALDAGTVRLDDVALATDDGFIQELQREDTTGLAQALRERRLAKRALDLPATDLPAGPPSWVADDPRLRARLEDRLARDVGLEPGELFLDFPTKAALLTIDLPLMKRDGSVVQLAGGDAGAYVGLARVAGELYRTARRLRVFVLRPARVPPKTIVDLVLMPREEAAALVSG